MNEINIAIDGPSGSGKGITSKLLAKKLGYSHLDTGAMYRAIGYLLHTKYDMTKETFNPQILNDLEFDLRFDNNNHVILNSEYIEDKIRTPLGCQLASDFSTIPQIRKYLVDIQKKIVKNKGYVAEGRDICSVVIPDAELKIYLTASIEERVNRRLKDYKNKDIKISFEELKKQIEERDYQDTHRLNSPSVKYSDAIEVDNTNLTIEQQVDKIYYLAINIVTHKSLS